MIYMRPQEIVEKFGPFKGVVHVGSHHAEERNDYIEAGIGKRLWIDANPTIANQLASRIASDNDVVVLAAVSETDGEKVKFNVASNGQSSSILPLKIHAEIYRDIVYTGYYEMTTTSLETILSHESAQPSDDYDLINLDIQGVELRALRGLGDRINQFRAVYAEVNTLELYEKCDMMSDLDAFLAERGFTKIGFKMYGNDGWGDALYVKS